MQKYKLLYISALLSLFTLGACNSTYLPGEDIASSTAIYSFSIRTSNNALAGIDTVFFSIDLINAKIFNADSLPYGTNITRIIPSIKSLDGLSACEFYVSRPGLGDTIYNYATNPNDSIDFTNSPVRLRVVSPDGSVERFYEVYVNVHQVKSDSLQWAVSGTTPIPSVFDTPISIGSAFSNNKLYCLTEDNKGNYCMASSEDPYSNLWEFSTPAFEGVENVNVESLRGGKEVLYILDESGELYKSFDDGITWSSTGYSYSEIFGELNGLPVGTAKDENGNYSFVNPSTGVSEPLPSEDFPVEGVSSGINVSFPMSVGEMMVVVGGRASNGTLSNSSWMYDGNKWLKVTSVPLPEGLEGMALVQYTTFKGYNSWVAQPYESLLAFGGKNKDGEINSTVYVSRDYGITWLKADKMLQFTEDTACTWGLNGFTINHLTKESDPEAEKLRIFAPISRATTPITEWDVPYIYLIGGKTSEGLINLDIWRGAINRLTFKPLY